jgi:hypothetical protein
MLHLAILMLDAQMIDWRETLTSYSRNAFLITLSMNNNGKEIPNSIIRKYAPIAAGVIG